MSNNDASFSQHMGLPLQIFLKLFTNPKEVASEEYLKETAALYSKVLAKALVLGQSVEKDLQSFIHEKEGTLNDEDIEKIKKIHAELDIPLDEHNIGAAQFKKSLEALMNVKIGQVMGQIISMPKGIQAVVGLFALVLSTDTAPSSLFNNDVNAKMKKLADTHLPHIQALKEKLQELGIDDLDKIYGLPDDEKAHIMQEIKEVLKDLPRLDLDSVNAETLLHEQTQQAIAKAKDALKKS